MLRCVSLELRKNRLLFIGMAVTFAVSLPASSLVAVMRDAAAAKGLAAALVFWTLVGLPGLAVLFGASAGAGLRADGARSAESLLPVSPRRRVFAAFLAAFAHLWLVALLILLGSFVLSPGWFTTLVTQDAWITTHPVVRSFFVVLIFALTYLLLMSFSLAYAVQHGIMGGMLGLVLGAAASLPLAWGLALHLQFGFRMAFVGLGASALAAALALGLWALYEVVPWIELGKRFRWYRACLAALAVVMSCAVCVAAFGFTQRRLRMRLRGVVDATMNHWGTEETTRALMPEVREVAGKGFLGSRLDGALVRVRPDGSRSVLIPGQDRSSREFLDRPWLRWVRSAAWDSDGSLWVLREQPRTYELWHGKPDGPLALQGIYGGWGIRIVRRGRELGLERYDSSLKRRMYAPLPGKGKAPVWRVGGKRFESFLRAGWEEDGLIARLSKDRRFLTQKLPSGKIRVWSLPGQGIRHYSFAALRPAVSMGKETVFLIGVQLARDERGLAVCREDGSVDVEWRLKGDGFFGLRVADDGTIWTWRDKGTLMAALPDGTFLPPVDLKAVLASLKAPFPTLWVLPDLVHREGRQAWLTVKDRMLIRVDLDKGTLLDRWDFPDAPDNRTQRWHYSGLQTTDTGLFYHSGRHLYFIRWDGSIRKLQSA